MKILINMNLQTFKAAIESKGHNSKILKGYSVYRGTKINTEKVNKNDKNNFDDINFIG